MFEMGWPAAIAFASIAFAIAWIIVTFLKNT